jgi:hypothetical protein
VSRGRLALALVAGGLVVGCAAPSTTDAGRDASGPDAHGPDAGAVLEIGTGEEGFEPLGDPPEVELVHGPQGGWHLTMAMRVWQLAPVGLRWQVHRADDGRVLADLGLDVRPGSYVPIDGALVRAGELVILGIDRAGEVVDRGVRIDAYVRAATGEMAARSMTVRVVDREP